MGRAGVLAVVMALLLGLPLLGVWIAGKSLWPYLEFPPRTDYAVHAPFSWIAFLAVALLTALAVGPILQRILTSNSRLQHSTLAAQDSALRTHHCCFPWWGWAGVAWTLLWWVLAWTRFTRMTSIQEHTFTPLWLGYIVTANAWTLSRTGRCLILDRPRFLLALFPVSAGFWWTFEYLDRFAQNWYYVGVDDLSLLSYILRGTVAFSTVLPAVVSTVDLLASFRRLSSGLDRFWRIPVRHVPPVAWSGLALSCAGLLGVGLWPEHLFGSVWVAPLLLAVSMQTLHGEPTIFAPIAQGDWRLAWHYGLAALICGIWWELWNWGSLAKWQYTVPYVHRFQIFEMPLLGYAGYFPFGLECLVAVHWCLRREHYAEAPLAVLHRVDSQG
ncbi:MAG: hypothetical protein P0111_04690 [Nitrospira sp.]|nr:hypothetical protein [Nitrospira sp.]